MTRPSVSPGEGVAKHQQTVEAACETCDGDGYVDIVDDWGGVIGPAPCPDCSPDDPLEAVDAALARLDGVAAGKEEA